MEYPFAPSLPIVGAGQSRLYLAESIAAAVKVKSDLSGQWNEAVRTANALAPLRRSFGAMMVFGSAPTSRIPLFAVGYTGWTTMTTLQNHLAGSSHIDGALIIDVGLYVSKLGTQAHGPLALWGLIVDLHTVANSLQSASPAPAAYG